MVGKLPGNHMDEHQFNAIYQSMIDLAYDAHLILETRNHVYDYFEKLADDCYLVEKMSTLDAAMQQRDRLSIVAECLSLEYLILHLREVEKFQPEDVGKLKAKIKRVMKESDYYGIRTEIKLAAVLSRNNIRFTRQERPDFMLHDKFEGLGIECTSGHFTKETGGESLS
jgi:hypothetical protein